MDAYACPDFVIEHLPAQDRTRLLEENTAWYNAATPSPMPPIITIQIEGRLCRMDRNAFLTLRGQIKREVVTHAEGGTWYVELLVDAQGWCYQIQEKDTLTPDEEALLQAGGRVYWVCVAAVDVPGTPPEHPSHAKALVLYHTVSR